MGEAAALGGHALHNLDHAGEEGGEGEEPAGAGLAAGAGGGEGDQHKGHGGGDIVAGGEEGIGDLDDPEPGDAGVEQREGSVGEAEGEREQSEAAGEGGELRQVFEVQEPQQEEPEGDVAERGDRRAKGIGEGDGPVQAQAVEDQADERGRG